MTDRLPRVVCLVYDSPPPGESQQAEEITVLVDRVEIAARTSVVADVPESFALGTADRGYGCASLKAHLTP